MMGLVPLILFLIFSHHVKIQLEGSYLQIRKKILIGNQSGILVLGFQAFESVRDNFCGLNHPDYDNLV